ncbi:MAG: hypothetical protein ACLGI3_04255 [Actinomycetes bacterium]
MSTATVMALAACGLAELTPDIGEMAGALAAAQGTADAAGADAVVASAAGLAAWVVWSWGALGLALTAASALPGVLGGTARAALRIAVPAGARRGAALALGMGLGVAGPLLAPAALPAPLSAAAAASWLPPEAADQAPDRTSVPSAPPVPDWPTGSSPGKPAPDWPPAAAPAGTRVVVPGDCLWHVAGERLLAVHGRSATDGEIAAATAAWWRANADVIGPDPDLLLPGQVLRPPEGR